MNKKKAAPSLFAADFFYLSRELEKIKSSGVDMIHYDVMDNHFVPNISFGPKLIEDIASKVGIPADVHLMIDLEASSLDAFLSLPIEHITIHLEAAQNNLLSLLKKIKKSGKTAGLSIKPKTPLKTLEPFLKEIDLILLMSVEPGFSGQSFIKKSLERLKNLKQSIGDLPVTIQIDGGISRDNYRNVLEAGADFLVIGSAFFKDKDPGEWVREIKGY
jgi:ribulose-phosphate 3-epimerase